MLMKNAIITLALTAFPTFTFASQSKNFASCFGDHHGSYLALWAITGSDGLLAQVNIAVSNDSDAPAKFFQVKEITKNGAILPVNSYSWAIRQAIKSEAAGDYYGFLKVTAKDSSGKILYMNLQKPIGALRHALAIDGIIEELKCPLTGIQD